MSNVPPSDHLNDSLSSQPVMPPDRRAMLAGIGGLAAGALIAGRAQAGPLNPPPGPVTSTPGPEPRIAINATNTPGTSTCVFRITQPGSYYLTGNLTGISGRHGIEITASNVTIDLNGYSLIGVAGSLSGILRVSPTVNDVFTIKNGTIASWGGDGISMQLAATGANRGSRFESLIATLNGGTGFNLPDGSVVVSCVSTRNLGAGFDVSNNATFIGCIAQNNGGDGFAESFGSNFTDCIARNNTGNGFFANIGTFNNCSATSNAPDGFVVTRSTLTGCNASFNSSMGFRMSSSQASHCSSTGSGVAGFLLNSGNTVQHSNVFSGPTGIEATGGDNRIDSNNVAGSTTGIRITGTGNFIVRNSASGGTEYSIGANNAAGPIVTASGMATLTNPMANFEY